MDLKLVNQAPIIYLVPALSKKTIVMEKKYFV
jgi:hypothetical protein